MISRLTRQGNMVLVVKPRAEEPGNWCQVVLALKLQLAAVRIRTDEQCKPMKARLCCMQPVRFGA